MVTEPMAKTVDKKLFDQTASALARLKREHAALKAESVHLFDELVRFRGLYNSLRGEHELMLARMEAQRRLEQVGVDREHCRRFMSAFACSDAETTEALTGCIIELIQSRQAKRAVHPAQEPSQ